MGVYEGKPIQWQVIDKQIDMDSTDGYKYLVVTTSSLYSARYQESLGDSGLSGLYESQLFTWTSSSLRRGLNNKLYSLFTTREVSLIVPTQIVDNGGCPLDDYKTLKSDSTIDRLFVLSISEVQKFKRYNSDCDGQWHGYLRGPFCDMQLSSGKHNLKVPRLYCGIDGYSHAYYNRNAMTPIRPAMWIRIKRSN